MTSLHAAAAALAGTPAGAGNARWPGNPGGMGPSSRPAFSDFSISYARSTEGYRIPPPRAAAAERGQNQLGAQILKNSLRAARGNGQHIPPFVN